LLSILAFAHTTGLRPLRVIANDGAFWRQLILVHGWGFEYRFDWNVPSWTVSSELLCYVAFVFAAPALARLTIGWVAALLVLLTLVLISVALSAVGYPGFDATLDWGMLRIGGEFLVGCLLYRAHAAAFLRNLPWGFIGLLALACSFFTLTRMVPLAILGFAIVVYALA
jgi:peptidoglycan/LPS O-acetylase OafA/YrhL